MSITNKDKERHAIIKNGIIELLKNSENALSSAEIQHELENNYKILASLQVVSRCLAILSKEGKSVIDFERKRHAFWKIKDQMDQENEQETRLPFGIDRNDIDFMNNGLALARLRKQKVKDYQRRFGEEVKNG